MALKMRRLPRALKAATNSNPVACDTYDKVKDTWANLINGRNLYTGNDSSVPDGMGTPMDIDSLEGGKGKGKHESKACNIRGKLGHKKED